MDWIPARHFRPARLGRVDLLVLHTAEGVRSARDLGAYFASTSRRASAHSGVDDTGARVDYVRWEHTAFAAPGANADGDHLELCGFARWSREVWLREHAGMLEAAALWLADRASARSVPLELLGPAELRADRRGVTTHDAVTRAFRRSTHTDPGPGFPLEVVLDRARVLLAGGVVGPPPGLAAPLVRGVPLYPGRLQRLGSTGPDVRNVQRRLRQRGWRIDVDGIYGRKTRDVVLAFQREKGLTADGIVGPTTWRALWALPIT